MDERTTGLILRTRLLTDTSLIVHWLTPDLGRLATVAKGARRPKSPFLGKLDLFYLADFSFRRSRRGDLHILREVSVREFHPLLRRELGCLQQAAYFAQLVELTTETETPLSTLFELFVDALNFLIEHPRLPLAVHAFEIKLLRELGLEPDYAKCALAAESKDVLKRVANTEWPALRQMSLDAKQSAQIGRFLSGWLLHHFGKVPSARPHFRNSIGEFRS
ncbi:MAG: DNA repair protein RecO [Verrucomicrobia bacterium]|nr:DNA repair protein RecO [Verrucomicrobiota bacterium]